MSKRKSSLIFGGSKAIQVVKKRKISENTSLSIYESKDEDKQLQYVGPARTSKLKSPNIQLRGHKGEVFCCEFSNKGELFCSAGFDQTIRIWESYGDNENTIAFKGHKNAVFDLCWNKDDEYLFSAGVDKIILWSIEYCKHVRKFRGHKKKVNCVGCISKDLFYSGSDDSLIKYWDRRTKDKAVVNIDVKYPVLTLDMKDEKYLYAGNISDNILAFDIRNSKCFSVMKGHKDAVTGIEISNDGNFLLSFSLDNTLRTWDLRPYVDDSRKLRNVFKGPVHGVDKNLLRCSWSRDDRKVSCGSSDKFVYVFDALTSKTLYKLPGHKSTINQVSFHPLEPIILSGSSDCSLFLGELQD